ncbi:AraC family transcriptional regulator [Aeromonas schubertii]|uniref:AraC family transcriptional regulator n=1 Tax=Aeromonas schubertii TaxID=652 RepID=UPI00067EA876|nr:helix-turn-helix transcriptional regulator [Aeromonas schubertii]KUE81115.1 AraC family transcriptional regulator [Aeromonas schubertii]
MGTLTLAEQDRQLTPPQPLYFRYSQIQGGNACAEHAHPWGQLSLISLGIMVVEVAGERLVAPPDYLIWVPADVPHSAYNEQTLDYTSIYVSHELARCLPGEPVLLSLTPLLRALLDDFTQRRVGHTREEWDRRQAELFIEKLARTRCQPSYLPMSRDRLLAPLLAALQAAPEDNRTLAEWATSLHTTERTLARRCQKELGMSLGQWRTRLRMVKALAWLRGDMPVQEIAWRLGYTSTSAFIAMFQREQGCAPQRYRQQLGGERA